MYDNQIKSASREMNISLFFAFAMFTILGVALGVLFNPAIIKFLESLTKIIKSC